MARRLLRRILWTFVIGIIFIALVFAGVAYYFRHVAHFKATLKTNVAERTKVHQVHYVSYSDIPSTYREAVIATEDRRFWSDPGIDPIGILRSLVVDVERDGYMEGGSTITQQLVDNTLLHRQKSLKYKLTQSIYAIGIYDTISKKQTFTMYANMIYFGQGAYGLYNASETYFGKPPQKLNAGELTMLAGVPNAPSVYDPLHHLSLARQRQKIVLENMVDDGLISKQGSTHIFNEPIRLRRSQR